jgi:hypothetical protein
MPSSVASAFLIFAVVLALSGAATVAIVAGSIGLVIELVLFYLSGLE